MSNKTDLSLLKARNECSKSGLRLTEKRSKVLKILLEAEEPLSAYDITGLFSKQYAESLSAMSAYRMLDFLMLANLVHKLETSGQYLACSHINCEHDHQLPQFLICDKCHAVDEIGLSKQLISELTASIKNTGFSLTSQQLELHGICQDCANQNMSSNT